MSLTVFISIMKKFKSIQYAKSVLILIISTICCELPVFSTFPCELALMKMLTVRDVRHAEIIRRKMRALRSNSLIGTELKCLIWRQMSSKVRSKRGHSPMSKRSSR